MGDTPVGVNLYRWLALDIRRPAIPNVEAYAKRLAERTAYRKNVMIPLS